MDAIRERELVKLVSHECRDVGEPRKTDYQSNSSVKHVEETGEHQGGQLGKNYNRVIESRRKHR